MSNNANKWSLYLILGIPLLGVLLTTAYYFYITGSGVQLGTHNNGVLINPPKNITELTLTQQNAPYQWDMGSGKWAFLLAGSGACAEACQQQLYLTRQIRAMLGKHMPRIQHIYIDLDQGLTADNRQWLAQEHPQLQVLDGQSAEALAWFAAQAPQLNLLEPGRFYIVDPLGWVMMYYTPEHDYKQINRDMKFLLKNS